MKNKNMVEKLEKRTNTFSFESDDFSYVNEKLLGINNLIEKAVSDAIWYGYDKGIIDYLDNLRKEIEVLTLQISDYLGE